jgi:hypothetical protein
VRGASAGVLAYGRGAVAVNTLAMGSRRSKPAVSGAHYAARHMGLQGLERACGPHTAHLARVPDQRRIKGPAPKGRLGQSAGARRDNTVTHRARDVGHEPATAEIQLWCLPTFRHQTVETGKSPASRAALASMGGVLTMIRQETPRAVTTAAARVSGSQT